MKNIKPETAYRGVVGSSFRDSVKHYKNPSSVVYRLIEEMER